MSSSDLATFESVQRAAQAIGGDAPRYAMHAKGMELPRQEPRIAKGFGLGHATSNRGPTTSTPCRR